MFLICRIKYLALVFLVDRKTEVYWRFYYLDGFVRVGRNRNVGVVEKEGFSDNRRFRANAFLLEYRCVIDIDRVLTPRSLSIF